MSCHIYILSNVKLSKLEKEPLSAKKNYSQIGSGEEVLDKSFAKLDYSSKTLKNSIRIYM